MDCAAFERTLTRAAGNCGGGGGGGGGGGADAKELAAQLADCVGFIALKDIAATAAARQQQRAGVVCGGRLELVVSKDGELSPGIPVVLNAACRLELDRAPCSKRPLLVALVKWQAVPIARVSESDGLVGHCDADGRWGGWPRPRSSTVPSTAGFYLEVEEMLAAAGADAEPRLKRPRTSLEPAAQHCYCLVRAVGPATSNKRRELAYFFAECTTVQGGACTSVQTLVFKGPGAVEWHPLLQPGDLVTIEGASLQPEYKLRPGCVRPVVVVEGGRCVVRRGVTEDAAGTLKKGCTGVLPGRAAAGHQVVESFEGVISQRVGAFVLEMDRDPRLKVFFSHVPIAGGEHGLRVGARVMLYNVALLRTCRGKQLHGLVFTLRSSFEVLEFAHDGLRPLVPFSRSLQKAIGTRTAQSALWLLESLARVQSKFGGAGTGVAVEGLLQVRRKTCGAGADREDTSLESKRSLVSEFVDAELGWLLPAIAGTTDPAGATKGERSTPLLVTVDDVWAWVRSQLSEGSRLERAPANRFRVSGSQGYGTCAWVLAGDARELEPASNPERKVCLVGWAATSQQTGQLCFRDKTGSVELAVPPNSPVRQLLLNWPGASATDFACLWLMDFRIVVEALTFRGLPKGPLTLCESGGAGRRRALWSSQLMLQGDTQGHVVVRVYIEPAVQEGSSGQVSLVASPRCGGEGASPPRQDQSMRESVEGVVISMPVLRRNVDQHEVTGTVLLGRRTGCVTIAFDEPPPDNTSSSTSTSTRGRFPRYWSCLSPGSAVCWHGLRPATPGQQCQSFVADGGSFFRQVPDPKALLAQVQASLRCPSPGFYRAGTEQLKLAEHGLDPPQSVGDVFDKCGAIQVLGRAWSLTGLVSAVNFADNTAKGRYAPSSVGAQRLGRVPFLFEARSVVLELRALRTEHTLLCYISSPGDRYLPPGLLRVGSEVVIRGLTLIKNAKRGLFCTARPDTAFEVARPPAAAMTTPPWPLARVRNLTSLSDVLATALHDPGNVHFANVRFDVVEIRRGRFAKHCANCGSELQGDLRAGAARPATCPMAHCERGLPFQVKANIEVLIEDGSAQGQLRVAGEMAAQLLGARADSAAATTPAGGCAWARICRLLEETDEPILSYYHKKLERLDDPCAARSLQARFEDQVVASGQLAFQAFRAVVKYHPNVRKEPRDLKPSAFKRGHPYRDDFALTKDIVVPRASLPLVPLIPLLIFPEDPLESCPTDSNTPEQ